MPRSPKITTSKMGSAVLDARRAVFLLFVVLKFLVRFLFVRTFGISTEKRNYGIYLRHSFEELGLTYLKLGQFLALRFDLLPKEVLVEMNNLFENVKNVPFEKIKRHIERELQKPLHELYKTFNEKPVGAATVAQVHEARTFNDEKVAVKVQRPGIERIFKADIRNLRRLSQIADFFKLGGVFLLVEVTDEFDKWTSRELSFITEANTAERLRNSALYYETIPKTYKHLSSDKVLTMEFIEGLSLAKVIDLINEDGFEGVRKYLPDLDLSIIGHRMANAILRQLFITGFFHGDPHPGNIFVRNDNTIAFLDFGIFGEMNEEQIEILSGHLENIAFGNINESFRYYAMQYQTTDDTDISQFEKEGKAVLRSWYQVSIDPYASAEDKHLGKVGGDMFDVIRRNKLKGTPSVLLFWRALYALDVSALKLADYFDLMSEMKAFFIRNRPGLYERIIGIGADRDIRFAMARLSVEGVHYLDKTFTDIVEKRNELPVKIHWPAAAPKYFNRELKGLFTGAVLLSLVVIVPVSRIAVPYYIFPALVTVAVFYFIISGINSLRSGYSRRRS